MTIQASTSVFCTMNDREGVTIVEVICSSSPFSKPYWKLGGRVKKAPCISVKIVSICQLLLVFGSRKVHTRLAQGSYTLWAHAGVHVQVSSNALNFIQPTFMKLTESPLLHEHCHNRYNKACNGACASRGEEYFWCNDWDGSWEYCSPRGGYTWILLYINYCCSPRKDCSCTWICFCIFR